MVQPVQATQENVTSEVDEKPDAVINTVETAAPVAPTPPVQPPLEQQQGETVPTEKMPIEKTDANQQ